MSYENLTQLIININQYTTIEFANKYNEIVIDLLMKNENNIIYDSFMHIKENYAEYFVEICKLIGNKINPLNN